MPEKRILDAETRRQLQGFVPFSVDSTADFTPEEFKDVKDDTLRPVFTVRSLRQSEIIQIKKSIADLPPNATSNDYMKMGEKNLAIIRACVMGWKNLFDAGNGAEIEYKSDTSGGCESLLWQTFPVWLHNEFLKYIQKISGLSRVDELSLKS